MGGIGEYWRDVKAHNKNMAAIRDCQVAKDIYWNRPGADIEHAKQVAAECERQQGRQHRNQYGTCYNSGRR